MDRICKKDILSTILLPLHRVILARGHFVERPTPTPSDRRKNKNVLSFLRVHVRRLVDRLARYDVIEDVQTEAGSGNMKSAGKCWR